MDQADRDNADVIDLAVQLCTRIDMMMEDVAPLALDASHDGIEQRVAELAGAIRVIATVAGATEALLG